jgi:hypothetical protein
MEWGWKYNIAWLAPEINGVGEGVINICQEYSYPNLYRHVDKILKLGEFERDQSLISGWITSNKTRHQIIAGLDEDLTSDLIELNNPYFVAEAWTFVYNEDNKPIALGKGSRRSSEIEDDGEANKYTDDAIFAVCIANEVRKNIMKTGMCLMPSSGK